MPQSDYHIPVASPQPLAAGRKHPTVRFGSMKCCTGTPATPGYRIGMCEITPPARDARPGLWPVTSCLAASPVRRWQHKCLFLCIHSAETSKTVLANYNNDGVACGVKSLVELLVSCSFPSAFFLRTTAVLYRFLSPRYSAHQV